MAWHRAATRSELLAAAPWLARDVAGIEIVIAMSDGRPYAAEDRCTHAGCPFSSEADLIDGLISCNCHGSQFQLATGEVVRGPAERPVRTFPVRFVGEDVEVEVGA
jgi:nitrite reductase/ring-hydroxylating ferredoxin subunit